MGIALGLHALPPQDDSSCNLTQDRHPLFSHGEVSAPLSCCFWAASAGPQFPEVFVCRLSSPTLSSAQQGCFVLLLAGFWGERLLIEAQVGLTLPTAGPHSETFPLVAAGTFA